MFVTFTVREIAAWVEGEVAGNPELVVRAARPLSDSPRSDEITVVIDERYLNQLHASNAGAAVVEQSAPLNGRTMIRVKDPLMAFVVIVQRMHVKAVPEWVGIHPTAVIHPSATIGDEAAIGPHAVIGQGSVLGNRCRLSQGVSIGNHCRLGDDVRLSPNVVIYDGCVLGNRVSIHANSVIGADGFGYRTIAGKHVKIPQVGTVELGDDVDIGACTTVDRATFGTTRIGEGTKVDNFVMIGHNCQIGRHNLLAAQVGIAGSVTTGDYVVMAGQVGIADHAKVGDRTILGAKSGVHGEVPADQRMLGAPATTASEQLRIMMSMEKLPEMRKDLRAIKKQLGLE